MKESFKSRLKISVIKVTKDSKENFLHLRCLSMKCSSSLKFFFATKNLQVKNIAVVCSRSSKKSGALIVTNFAPHATLSKREKSGRNRVRTPVSHVAVGQMHKLSNAK